MTSGLFRDRSNEYAIAYNQRNGNPWHGEGQAFDGLMTVEEALKASHCDFVVHKVPMETTVIDLEGTYRLDVADQYVTVRNNAATESGYEAFGPVGKVYEPFQPDELFEFAAEVAAHAPGQACIDVGGALFGGRMVFCHVDLGAVTVDPDGINDTILTGLAAMTRFDAKMSTVLYLANIRPVCNNTVTAGLRATQRKITIRHTAGQVARVEEAQRALGFIIARRDTVVEAAERLLRVECSLSDVERVVAGVFPKPEPGESDSRKRNWDERFQMIAANFDVEVETVGSNGWAVTNAIGEFLDHQQKGDVHARNLKAMTGQTDELKAKAEALVLA